MNTPQIDRQLTLFSSLLAEAPLNVVSRADRDRVRERHVDESVAITRALDLPRGAHCLDLGSGGGLPGVVIGIVRRDVHVVCLDATRKKIAFIDAAVRRLGTDNVRAVAGRAERLARSDLRASFDVVVSRAVARVSVAAELGRGFVRPGGEMVVVKGPQHRDEVNGAHRVLSTLDFTALAVEPVEVPGRSAWLVRLRAGGDLGQHVPRQDGEPARNPLERQ